MRRQSWLVSLFLIHVTCSGQSREGYRPAQEAAVSEPNVDALFSAALAARGPAYLKARDGVLAGGPSAIGALKTKRASPDWKVALQANILTGWLVNPAVFRKCIDFVDGKLPGNPGITGEFSPVQRARAIAGLGPAATPCVLELLIKVRGLDGKQVAAIVGALRLMADPTAVDPLVSLLKDDDPDLRMNAAGLLGTFKEPRTIPPLIAVLTDTKQTDDARAAAAGSLGELGAQQAAPTL